MKRLACLGLSLLGSLPLTAATADQTESIESLIEMIQKRAGEDVQIDHYGNLLVVTGSSSHVPATVNARLNQRVTAQFDSAPIEDVVDFLRKATNLNFIVDPTLVSSTVTLDVKDMRLDHVLNWIEKVGGVHVSWANEAFYVSTEMAKSFTPTTRVYDVTDVVTPVQDFPGPQLAYDSKEGGGFTLFQK